MAKKNTREEIIRHGENLFADKGYTGAGMDELARLAGVPKSLIYYHFKSKEGVLKAILEGFKSNLLAFICENLESSFPVEQDREGYTRRFISFYEKNRRVLKIILSESFKSSPASTFLFDIVSLTFKTEVKRHYKKNNPTPSAPLSVEEKQKAIENYMIFEFFTGLMPLFAFAVYQKGWADHFGMDEDHIRELFVTAFKNTHLAGHEKLREMSSGTKTGKGE